MTGEVKCPRCGQPASERPPCRHLRWFPQRGGPIEFARSIVADRSTQRLVPTNIPRDWWESQYDWLLERITTRIDVIDGYCFALPGELDLLRLDIKHRYTPGPDREWERDPP